MMIPTAKYAVASVTLILASAVTLQMSFFARDSGFGLANTFLMASGAIFTVSLWTLGKMIITLKGSRK